MSNVRVSVDGMASAIMDALKGYTDDLGTETVEAVKKVGKEGVKQLKANSPVRHSKGGKPGTYAKGWRFKVVSESSDKIEGVIHNATNPGLAHLTEKGHALRQGGRAGARVHIAPVEQSTSEALEREIEQRASKV